MIRTWWCRFISCNKSATQVGGVENRGGCALVGVEDTEKAELEAGGVWGGA